MKKFITLLITFMLCFSLTYAEQTEDVASKPHSETVTVLEPKGDWSVTITSSLDGKESVISGTEVTLTAHFSGKREGDTLQYIWQERKSEDGKWKDVGTDSTEYKFNITAENVTHQWRVIVRVTW